MGNVRLLTTSQNGYWTFAGAAGQRVFFKFTGGTFSGITKAVVRIYKPDGGTLVSTTYCGTSCVIDTTVLPADGTYKIVLDPQDTATGSLTAELVAS